VNVLHAPFNFGSQASSLADAENAVRHENGERGWSWSVDFEPLPRFSEATKVFAAPNGWAGTLHRSLRPFFYGLRHAAEFNVLHLYSGRSLLRCEGRFALFDRRDLPLWKALGKKVFVTFQGCEVRYRSATRHRPFSPCQPGVCDIRGCDASFETKLRRWADTLLRWADKAFCLNPDLLAHVPTAEFLPYVALPVNVGHVSNVPAKRHVGNVPHKPIIVHAPTNRSIKGTEFLLAASESLQSTYPHELRLVEGLPRDQALEVYAQADILVDQLRLGWYGALAVEAMARSVPVVAYLNEDDLARIPPTMGDELPIQNASPATLAATLARLLEDAALRQDLGCRGLRFVRRWHHPVKIARRMLDLYRDPSQSFWAGYDPEAET
jgi:hypothetical protein